MRTAVVTGAASGIGRALTELLAADGFTVYASDIQPNNGAHGLVRPVIADVSRPADMDRLAQEASDVEMVCLNAGIVGTSMGAPWEAPLEEWNRVLSVNLLGVVNGLRAFVPRILRRGQPSHILITASLAGLVTFPAGGWSNGTKDHAGGNLAGVQVMRDLPRWARLFETGKFDGKALVGVSVPLDRWREAVEAALDRMVQSVAEMSLP